MGRQIRRPRKKVAGSKKSEVSASAPGAGARAPVHAVCTEPSRLAEWPEARGASSPGSNLGERNVLYQLRQDEYTVSLEIRRCARKPGELLQTIFFMKLTNDLMHDDAGWPPISRRDQLTASLLRTFEIYS